jgi:phage antirepressor YoqD-like protein
MENNIPYQRYIDNGVFRTVEVIQGNTIYIQTLITGKGQFYLKKRLKNVKQEVWLW